MPFEIRDALIPIAEGHAVDRGWPVETGGRPHGVTWHWTATRTLEECRRLIGGEEPSRRGRASAHYAVGRSFTEGVERYVELDNRSWHAGKHQTLRWDGRPCHGPQHKGARTTIGVETVNLGHARRGLEAAPDWLAAASPSGWWQVRVQPWSEEQIEMMIAVGKEIQQRWPHLGPDDHHGHHDLCPGYKVDVVGFPFARVLRGIYGDPGLADVWSPFWTLRQRRRALQNLGYDVSSEQPRQWRRTHRLSLKRFQRDQGLVEDGMWTVSVSRRAHALLLERGESP